MASISGSSEIAKRYALALFELAREQGQIDQVAADLSALENMVRGSDDFMKLMMNVTLRRDDQIKCLAALAEAAQFSALTRQFLGTLGAKRRLAALPDIIAAAQSEIEEFKGEVTADVTSAETLEKSQVDAIAAALKKVLGKTVRIHAMQDIDIMGGLVVKVGSQLIDSSVRTKLERLTRALTTQNISSDKTKMREVA